MADAISFFALLMSPAGNTPYGRIVNYSCSAMPPGYKTLIPAITPLRAEGTWVACLM